MGALAPLAASFTAPAQQPVTAAQAGEVIGLAVLAAATSAFSVIFLPAAPAAGTLWQAANASAQKIGGYDVAVKTACEAAKRVFANA